MQNNNDGVNRLEGMVTEDDAISQQERDDNCIETNQSIEDLITNDPFDSPTYERVLVPSEACRRHLSKERDSRDFATQTTVVWPPELVVPEEGDGLFRVVFQRIQTGKEMSGKD